MGPPALVVAASNRRCTRTSEFDIPESSQPHFSRRFPRVGALFQCKMQFDEVEGTYTTSRRAPDTMSEDFPHRTAMEVEKRITTEFTTSTSSERAGKATTRVM